VELIILVVLLTLGYAVGRWQEARHFVLIRGREKELAGVLAFSTRHLPGDLPSVETRLVCGSAVISVDYFKQFSAALRGLLGGRISAYESLVERARREALLRMKSDAAKHGASAVFNVKLETASITKGARNQIGCVEVLAYGTALIATKTG